MGLLITLYLITVNVYGTIKAPPGRGFSYIESWMIGVQFCILLAIFEYGYILSSKKLNNESTKEGKINPSSNSKSIKKKIVDKEQFHKLIDLITLAISITFFFSFNIVYWFKI